MNDYELFLKTSQQIFMSLRHWCDVVDSYGPYTLCSSTYSLTWVPPNSVAPALLETGGLWLREYKGSWNLEVVDKQTPSFQFLWHPSSSSSSHIPPCTRKHQRPHQLIPCLPSGNLTHVAMENTTFINYLPMTSGNSQFSIATSLRYCQRTRGYRGFIKFLGGYPLVN